MHRNAVQDGSSLGFDIHLSSTFHRPGSSGFSESRSNPCLTERDVFIHRLNGLSMAGHLELSHKHNYYQSPYRAGLRTAALSLMGKQVNGPIKNVNCLGINKNWRKKTFLCLDERKWCCYSFGFDLDHLGVSQNVERSQL